MRHPSSCGSRRATGYRTLNVRSRPSLASPPTIFEQPFRCGMQRSLKIISPLDSLQATGGC